MYGNQLRTAPGVLQRFDSIFGCEPPHNEGQLAVGCHLDRCQINSLYILCGVSTTSIHSYNKFNIVHGFSLLFIIRG
jgi:hypothetical protein